MTKSPLRSSILDFDAVLTTEQIQAYETTHPFSANQRAMLAILTCSSQQLKNYFLSKYHHQQNLLTWLAMIEDYTEHLSTLLELAECAGLRLASVATITPTSCSLF